VAINKVLFKIKLKQFLNKIEKNRTSTIVAKKWTFDFKCHNFSRVFPTLVVIIEIDKTFRLMKLKKNIAVSETGFIFDPSTGDSYTLNPVGLELLEMIKQGKSFADITSALTSKYDVDPNAFERYYYDFVSTLKQMQLVDEDE
jgi:PqqD family protein of HPr-rel-A system